MFSINLFINKNLCEKISEKGGRKFLFFINLKRNPLDSSSNGKKWFSTFKYTKIRPTGNSFTKLLFYASRKKSWQKKGWHSNIFKKLYKIQNNKTPFCF